MKNDTIYASVTIRNDINKCYIFTTNVEKVRLHLKITNLQY